nr:uncharacterized protein LOC109764297 [Aegilops tauschii subsp. strangulata]
MTADDLKKLEAELKERESLLQTRQEELDRCAAEMGKAPATSPAASTPSPSTYATSIKLHVPITLDLTASNYTNWHELFLVALGRYGLTAHVIGDAGTTPSDTSPASDWGRDDYTVLSWIYGSISIDLFGIVMRPGSTARTIWDAIENLFHDNKKHRAIQLEAEFRNTPQGDMTVGDYCTKLKSLADSLVDVGQTISDETLVLTLLRGLNDSFAHLRSFLPFQVPFPSFLQTRSALILEESQKKTDAKNAASTALWASGNSITPSAGGEHAPLPISGGVGSGGRGTGSTFNRGSGRGRGGRGGRGRGRDNPWQFNPWTGAPTRAYLQQQHTQAPWQQPSSSWQSRLWQAPAPGLLGPRPNTAPQAYTAYGHANNNSNMLQHLHQARWSTLRF